MFVALYFVIGLIVIPIATRVWLANTSERVDRYDGGDWGLMCLPIVFGVFIWPLVAIGLFVYYSRGFFIKWFFGLDKNGMNKQQRAEKAQEAKEIARLDELIELLKSNCALLSDLTDTIDIPTLEMLQGLNEMYFNEADVLSDKHYRMYKSSAVSDARSSFNKMYVLVRRVAEMRANREKMEKTQ